MKYCSIFIIVILISINASFASSAEDIEVTIKAVVKNYLATRFLNATFMFANDDEILDMGAKGISSLEDGTQLKVNKKMPIASGTKPITAAAILKLYDRGALNITDKISKHLGQDSGVWYDKIPDWAEQVSIHNLLTHSSGIKEYFMNLSINPNLALDEINKSIINFAAVHPTKFIPGTQYDYANTNYIILGMIIEKISNKSLAQFFNDEFFVPLKMKSSHLASHDEYLSIRQGTIGHPYPERYLAIATNKKPKLELLRADIYFVPYADGGVISNTRDIITWYRALHQGKVLSEKSYKMMVTKYLQAPMDKSGRKNYIGYGVYISELPSGDRMIHHSGRYEGTISESGYIPEQHLYFAILGNVSMKDSLEMPDIDRNKIENQLDLVYFREAVLHAVLW